MATNKIVTKSENFNVEYCASVVRIGECFPIEGKDKIQRTIVNGETIVISKDIKEGDVMIYASNETQLNKSFLGANNLFESGASELNANYGELKELIDKKDELKKSIERLEKRNKALDLNAKYLVFYESEVVACMGDVDKISNLNAKRDIARKFIMKFTTDVTDTNTDTEFVTQAKALFDQTKINIASAKEELDTISKSIKTKVGFFNKTGRVRSIRLGGVSSMGFLFGAKELENWKPCVKDINFDELVGEDFDTVDGEEFIKAYVPYVPPQRTSMSKDQKRNKKVEKFDRMVKGEFEFHYSTSPLPKCIQYFSPTDEVDITIKIHGTSAIFGKLKVKNPKKLPLHKALWNKFVDTTGWFKDHRIDDYTVEYGNVTSSRTVIKNQYINKEVTDGYYGVDVWSEYGNLIYPYLEEGMTIYGEIMGYLTGSDKMIQKKYDYGCEVGTNKLMIYRITTTDPNTNLKHEWEIEDVKKWTEDLITRLESIGETELAERIHPIDILYHGTLANLYPDLSLTEHWHENLLELMRNDSERFHMEEKCPLCNNNVPFEGVVIRKVGDPRVEAFKLKTKAFTEHERAFIDEVEKGNETLPDEMIETYA